MEEEEGESKGGIRTLKAPGSLSLLFFSQALEAAQIKLLDMNLIKVFISNKSSKQ